MKNYILAIIFTIIGFTNTFGAHIPGGNLTWQCTGNPNEYVISMNLFVSCPDFLSSSYSISISNTCGLANPNITLPQLGQPVEISQICPSQINLSDCPPGTGGIPGVMMYTYQTTIVLPAGCDSWDFEFDLCCRDASTNTNGGTGNEMFFHSQMNSTTAPCDGSPYITAQPIPYVCSGIQQTYCPGAIDPDGDSLAYSLVNPLASGGASITHPAPYSPTMPLQNLVMDPVTGCITFNQPTTGNFVVTYLIEAFNAAGQLTGFIYHDFQFEVINNGNCQPVIDPGTTGATNVTGNAALLNPNTIEICEGQSICFDLTFSSPAPLTVLALDSSNTNVFTALPGATLTQTGTNPATFTICWTVPAGASPNTQFTIGVSDGACPIENLASYPMNINVINSTVASPDLTICGGQVAPLSAVGGTIFNWSAISGPSIVVGTNFSCNPCSNPVATPASTTTYLVTSNLIGGCVNTDTVTVNVAPDFTPTVTQSTSSACLFDPIQLDVAVNPAGAGYTYQWSPSTFLSADNISNPIANITIPGNHTYTVNITSPGGCLKTETITINVIAFVVPDISILTPDSIIACGDSVLIDLDLGGGVPVVTGPSATNTCSQPTTQTIIGTGTTNISSAPSPYYGFYEDGRIQFIYTAAELNAMGFLGGKITEISFDVVLKASTAPYNGLTIKMGPTALIDFSSTTTFVTGLFTTYTSPSYTTVLGWNTHVLNTAYEWNGTDNLIIEVCFDNSGWTSTDQLAQTATTGKMVLYDYTDGAVGCTLSTPYTSTQQLNRPNIRLTQCPTVPDPLAYNYSWTPNTNIATSTMQNPTVFPSQPTTYVVTVSDLGGNCSDTDSLTITVACSACYQPAIQITNPTCKDDTDGKIIIDPSYVLGSEIQSFTWKDSITNTVLQTTPNLVAGMRDSLINIGAGAYTISLIDTSGCIRDTTIWLTEPDSVVINYITPDSLICIGGNKTIEAIAIGGSGTSYTYTWTNLSTGTNIPGNGPHTVSPIISPTCYSVMATDDLGCISSNQQMCISLFPNIIASTTNNSLSICPNSSINVDVTAIGGSGTGYNYDWYENGILIGNGSIFNVTPTSAATTYTAVVTDNCTTPPDSITVFIDWYGLVVPDFTRNKPDSCFPITIQFENTSTPVNLVANSEWIFSDGTTLTGNTITRTLNSAGCQDLSLTVTTIDGCVVDTTKTNFICPFDYPDADFYINPEVADLLNTNIDFINESSGAVPLSFLWNFNSGLNPDLSYLTNPTFTFPDNEPNQYPVVLEVTDKNGCVTEITRTVIINGIYLFYVPNAFTPDGDGKNEIFKPSGSGIDLTRYTMQIFDRWGQLIFETNDATIGWDGTSNGKYVPNGTYVWRINTKEEFSPIHHKNVGHVNLIR